MAEAKATAPIKLYFFPRSHHLGGNVFAGSHGLRGSPVKLKKQVEDTSKTLKYLGLNVDSINKTTGLETEEFFFSSFKKNKILKNITFDSISQTLK